jgi:hypothetical protein
MWVGRGFDSDGDGDNDFFMATQVQPLSPKQAGAIGAVVVGLVVLGAIALGLALVIEWFGNAQNQHALATGAAAVWSLVIKICFWGFLGLAMVTGIAVMILGIVYGKR